MPSPYRINYFKEAAREYRRLDGSQKVFVDKAIARIKYFGMNCGQELHGDLVGYRKLKNRKMGLRIVFGESADGIDIIDIIAIGKRSDNEVYQNAEHRLN